MIPKCKCGKAITTDLYPVRRMSSTTEKDYYGEGQHRIDSFIKKGTFMHSKRYFTRSWIHLAHPPECIMVSAENVLDHSNMGYERGRGCCDPSHWPLHCQCGSLIGEVNIDCWQDKRVELFLHRIDLTYGKRTTVASKAD